MPKQFGTYCFGLFLTCLLAGQAHSSEYDQALNTALRNLGEPVRFCPKFTSSPELLKIVLPSTIHVQKVVPRNVSANTIAELLKVCEINPSETFKGGTRGVFGTPGVKYFGSLERNQTLTLIPAQGWIKYDCLGAITNVSGVAPSEGEAVQRGLEMAKLLGLSKDKDLMKRSGTNRFDYVFEKTERSSQNKPSRIVSQGVFFRRAIDGFRVVTGHHYGGLRVRFGIAGKLHEMELTARATQPGSVIQIAPMAEQIKIFRECKQIFALKETDSWNAVKRDKEAVLKLEDVEVIYFEDAPEKFQKIIPPLLRWEGELRSHGKSETVIFFTPIGQRK